MPTREELRFRLHGIINGKREARGPRGDTIAKNDKDLLLLHKQKEEDFIKFKQTLEAAGFGVLDNGKVRS